MSAPAIDIDESLRMADSQVLSPAFQVHSISQPFILRLDQAQHRGMSDDELTFWNWIWRIQLRPAPDFIVDVGSGEAVDQIEPPPVDLYLEMRG